MRGRSHRFQSVDTHDDWVDGSWTVDCVCGVTFDDGEEMVNCDECGVWVHTRCSKYVKDEELFACHKCKNKNSRNISHNENEETEVAQLLVELPVKTVRLDSSYRGPARKPISLWTNIPMENRVHVQGNPGGNPRLFNGLSSVFTPELWKCSGYVPKKFNFQYKEFPCWDEKDGGDKKEEGKHYDKENPVDTGAGMLFSLSKESVHGTPVAAMMGMRGRDEEGLFERKVYLKEMSKRDSKCVAQSGMRKERSLLRPAVIHSGKRKKEDFGVSKDRNGKKIARASEKEAGDRKKDVLASRTVFRPFSDGKQLEFYEDRGPKSLKTDIQNTKNKCLPEDVHPESVSECHLSVDSGVDKPKSNLAFNECPLYAFSTDASRPNYSNIDELEAETTGHQTAEAIKSLPMTCDVSWSISELNDARNFSVKQEGENAIDKLDDNMKFSAQNAGKPLPEDVASVQQGSLGNQIPKDSIGDMSWTSVLPNVEVKTEVVSEIYRGHLNPRSCFGDPKVQCESDNGMSKTSKVNDVSSTDHQALDTRKTSEVVSHCYTIKVHEVTGDPHRIKREQESSDFCADVPKSCSECNDLVRAEEHSKVEGNSQNFSALASYHTMAACVARSSNSQNLKSTDAQNADFNNKQKAISDISIRKDCDVSNVVMGEEKHDMAWKSVREQSKSYVNSVSKLSHSSRISDSSKLTLSDAKDYASFLSSKRSLQNAPITSGSDESAGSLPSQCTLQAQNKMSTSTLPLKGNKLGKSDIQPLPKVNHAPLMHHPVASNSPAPLSDEELALLLHQELNSSPRVPRVPRVRHTGSLPQFSSPTAVSMLIKRTSSSGGKDHSLVSKRRNKDACGDGFSSHELDNESRKSHRVLSPDVRRQDVGYPVDANTTREDNRSSIAIGPTKKSKPPAFTITAYSGPSSSTEVTDHNASSIRSSPRNISDDDTGTNRGSVHRTLPGLINEIMSKGRRLTYEELCNAVLPHWPHLRKHNGERYAYSSHSQAVLDCLRNRHEWALLVDRGPKTSSSRKRQKLDADESEDNADESEDNEYGNGVTATESGNKGLEPQREDFPKGKRKARKRRRLALQGRGIKDIRKRKVDLPSDGDVSLFSNSSGESVFSDVDSHGGAACHAGSEASSSSDEMGTL